MGTTVSNSSPEPEEKNIVERAWRILNQKPLRMASMLRLSRLMNDAQAQEKLLLLNSGVIKRLLDMIDERSHVIPKSTSQGQNSASQKGGTASGSNAQPTASGGQQQKSPPKSGRNNFVTQITTGRRKSNSYNMPHRGIGYGFGSTRSQWDIERTIEQQMVREEQLVWLMNAFTAFLYCASPDFGDAEEILERARERDRTHITPELIALIEHCAIVPMLEYHLKNESIFDISEHMEFYQGLLETACSLALYPQLAAFLILPRSSSYVGGPLRSANTAERFVVVNLLPRFRDHVLIYLSTPSVGMGSPDFRLLDFIQRVQKLCTLITSAASYMIQHHLQSGTSRRDASVGSPSVNTLSSSISSNSTLAILNHRRDSIVHSGEENSPGSPMSSVQAHHIQAPSSIIEEEEEVNASTNENIQMTNPTTSSLPSAVPIVDEQGSAMNANTNATEKAVNYTNALKKFQIHTWKFIGDFGKLVVPFTYRKEAKSLNPFSPSLKERTKRIARELASLHNALPMNWSNCIFVAVDEGRCDLMKVLITGPDDTPYQNGCFEFDLFFPSGYPHSPPKVSFLTTGNGEVRFNPNLYQDGKVCLSILNTWEGRPEEKWNPYCSVLQVLISIQALIFVKEPYFNEPGFERYMTTEKGRHLSNAYNQQLQHATLHYAVLEQLKQPPEYFRDVIRRHFWYKKDAIVEQANHWLRQTQTDLLANAKEKEKEKKGTAAMASVAAENGLGSVSLRSMERTVEALLQELNQLQCLD